MITLRKWLGQFKDRFNDEELNTRVYKAIIKISTVNLDTGNVECHRFDYDSKESLMKKEIRR